MLSIGAMNGGQAGYYQDLSKKEDYYLKGERNESVWMGQGAHARGLAGQAVESEAFLHLFHGFSEDGTQKLVQNAGKNNPTDYHRHKPGWDLCFSACKSVSIAWSVAALPLRAALEDAQSRAVDAAIGHLERTAAFTRRAQGKGWEPVGLTVAVFQHGSSRVQDMQLHSHALVLNFGVRADGKTSALVSKTLYEAKMEAGQVYRNHLAQQVERLGFGVAWQETKRGRLFEIAGIAQEALKHFSTRRAQIEARMEKEQVIGSREAERAALHTRSVKSHLPSEELFRRWETEAAKYGITRDSVEALRQTRAAQVKSNRAAPVLAAPSALAPDVVQERAVQPERPRPTLWNDPAPINARGKSLVDVDAASLRMRTDAAAQEALGAFRRYKPTVSSDALFTAVASYLDKQNLSIAYVPRAVAAHLASDAALRATDAVRVARETAQEGLSRATPLLQARPRVASSAFASPAAPLREASFLREAARAVFGRQAEPRAHEEDRPRPTRSEAQLFRTVQRAARQSSVCTWAVVKTAQAIDELLHWKLSEEAVRTLHHITRRAGNVKVLEKEQGADKTWVLRAARKAWRLQGYTVYDTTLSHKHRKLLQYAAGVHAKTLASRMLSLHKGYLQVNRKSVFVLEEAQKLDAESLNDFLRLVVKRGGKVVLVGQNIRADSPLAQISDAVKGVRLPRAESVRAAPSVCPARAARGEAARRAEQTARAEAAQRIAQDKRRQEETERAAQTKRAAEQREQDKAAREKTARDKAERAERPLRAAKRLAAQEGAPGLDAYIKRADVTIKDTRREAILAMAKDWAAQGNPKRHLLVADRPSDVAELNRAAQRERLQAKELGVVSIKIGSQRFYKGDYVIFAKGSEMAGVDAGQRGQITNVVPFARIVEVRMEDGRTVVVPTALFKHLQLGYAVTSKQLQTMTPTVTNASLYLPDGTQDVQALMRAHRGLKIYTDAATATRYFPYLLVTEEKERQLTHFKAQGSRVEKASGMSLSLSRDL